MHGNVSHASGRLELPGQYSHIRHCSKLMASFSPGDISTEMGSGLCEAAPHGLLAVQVPTAPEESLAQSRSGGCWQQGTLPLPLCGLCIFTFAGGLESVLGGGLCPLNSSFVMYHPGMSEENMS